MQTCPLRAECSGKARFLGTTPEAAIERVHHHLVQSSSHWKSCAVADELTLDLEVLWNDDYEDVDTPQLPPKRARLAIGGAPLAIAPSAAPTSSHSHMHHVIKDAIAAVKSAQNAAVQSELLATAAATAFSEQADVFGEHVRKLEACLEEV